MANDNTFLSDGVYVKHDGFHVVLTGDYGKVFLDPTTLFLLIQWLWTTCYNQFSAILSRLSITR